MEDRVAYYTWLTRMVSNFPDIKLLIGEFANSFATRRRKQPSPTK
jgi:hypothetical protein